MESVESLTNQLRTIKQAAELLTRHDGEQWCQGTMAWSRKMGYSVSPNNPTATDFCAIGAVEFAAHDAATCVSLLRRLREHSVRLYGREITYINDGQYPVRGEPDIINQGPEDRYMVLVVFWNVAIDLERELRGETE